MSISCEGSLIKSITVAFFYGLITLSLLLIAPLGLTSVITNTIDVSIYSLAVTIAFDLITALLLKSSANKFLDYSYQDLKTGAIKLNKINNILQKKYEDK
ncbi:CRISPR-associated protein Csx18 [Cyanobacterium sp. Dongsha4]|uniref:CRISPR-associated protein Csx18 n=1 Tax=Cyanobacterium sp. DS4 TaxID=2878255 RepID=UPI002E7FD15D|nr:CRISPR-associated protein Csx18 [Cyanobacterium sp. Dongsha4]WVL00443.1 hypothetical protein Dongsha4_17625 [Cyanobacterium sp. Dongsha4]